MTGDLRADDDSSAAPAAEESVDEVTAAPATEQALAPVADEESGHRPAPDWWEDGSSGETDPTG